MTHLHFRLAKTQRGRGRVRGKKTKKKLRLQHEEKPFSRFLPSSSSSSFPRQGRRATASSTAREWGQREETLSSLAFSLRPSLFLFLSVSVRQIMKMSRNQWPHSFHCLFRRGWDDTYWILINKKRDTECKCVCARRGTKQNTTHCGRGAKPTPSTPPTAIPTPHLSDRRQRIVLQSSKSDTGTLIPEAIYCSSSSKNKR